MFFDDTHLRIISNIYKMSSLLSAWTYSDNFVDLWSKKLWNTTFQRLLLF